MIKNWKLFKEKYDEVDDSDWDIEDDDYEPSEEDLEDILDDNDIDLEIENLCSLIRKYLKNSDLSSLVEYKDGDLTIYIFLEKKEKIGLLTSILEVLKNLHNDILPEYESSVELYQNKTKEPLLIISLYRDDEGDGDKNKK
jgi:hypothetical protein